MAKVAFSKLGCKVNEDFHVVKFNDMEIEIKHYLPLDDKLALIERVISAAHDESFNFNNPLKLKVFSLIEIITAYTNISFTDKQKENPGKLYDAIVCGGLEKFIESEGPQDELNKLYQAINTSMENIYKYQHSIGGLLEVMKTDYATLDEQAADIQTKLKDPQNLGLVKDILTKLG